MSKRINFFMTIQHEMFLLSVISFLLVSLLISGVFLTLLYDNRTNSAKDSLKECNSQIVTFAQGLFRENAAILELLAKDETVINAGYGDEEELLQIFDNVLHGNENVTYAYAGYADGSLHIRGYTTPKGYSVIWRPWYQQAISKDEVAQLVYRDTATDVWLFSQCISLKNSQGNIVGAIALDCSNESISKQLSSKYRYKSQRSFIINSNGTVLLHPLEEYINRSLRLYMDEDTWETVMAGGNYAEYRLDGVPSMAYLEQIPDTSFTVVTTIDTKEVKSETGQQLGDIIRAADEMMYEKKILESMEMKRKTVANIISAAEREGLVLPLSGQETQILKIFSDALCPESETLLLESYRLRRIGLCSSLFSLEDNKAVLNKRHTEMGYRILSSLEAYRSVAACVLHYKEHWDGSGWPSGLAGLDIPLLSRIIAVTEGYIENGHEHLLKKSGIWYDQQLTQLLNEMKP